MLIAHSSLEDEKGNDKRLRFIWGPSHRQIYNKISSLEHAIQRCWKTFSILRSVPGRLSGHDRLRNAAGTTLAFSMLRRKLICRQYTKKQLLSGLSPNGSRRDSSLKSSKGTNQKRTHTRDDASVSCCLWTREPRPKRLKDSSSTMTTLNRLDPSSNVL